MLGTHENEIANAEVIEGTSVADGVDDDVVGLISFVRGNDFFDYEAKYKGKSEEITPARISESLTKCVQKETIEIYRRLH